MARLEKYLLLCMRVGFVCPEAWCMKEGRGACGLRVRGVRRTLPIAFSGILVRLRDPESTPSLACLTITAQSVLQERKAVPHLPEVETRAT